MNIELFQKIPLEAIIYVKKIHIWIHIFKLYMAGGIIVYRKCCSEQHVWWQSTELEWTTPSIKRVPCFAQHKQPPDFKPCVKTTLMWLYMQIIYMYCPILRKKYCPTINVFKYWCVTNTSIARPCNLNTNRHCVVLLCRRENQLLVDSGPSYLVTRSCTDSLLTKVLSNPLFQTFTIVLFLTFYFVVM